VNKKIVIPIGAGIAIIVIGIIAIYNQEPEIIEPQIIKPVEVEINYNNSESQEMSDIDKKLEVIENKARDNYYEPAPREWITSGPFQIDRTEYRIGEKIFITINGLEEDEKGQVAFLRNLNDTHYSVFQTIPFDGKNKPAFNYYTDVRLSQALGICSVEDIVGEWTVVFRGTDYENLKFEFINEFIPGEEDSFENPVC
jgi:hypothetical protein